MGNVIKISGRTLKKVLDRLIREQEGPFDDRDPLIAELRDLIDTDGDVSGDLIDRMENEGKPLRRGRGSIYVDILVPETDDKEFDRKVALKVLEHYADRMKVDCHIGGFGFRKDDVGDPYDGKF